MFRTRLLPWVVKSPTSAHLPQTSEVMGLLVCPATASCLVTRGRCRQVMVSERSSPNGNGLVCRRLPAAAWVGIMSENGRRTQKSSRFSFPQKKSYPVQSHVRLHRARAWRGALDVLDLLCKEGTRFMSRAPGVVSAALQCPALTVPSPRRAQSLCS